MDTDWGELIKFALFMGAFLLFYVFLMSLIGAQGRIGKWLDWVIMTALGVAAFEEWQNRKSGGIIGLIASRKKGSSAAVSNTPAATLPPPPVPAGWKSDPLGRHDLRYWDGVEWTDDVSSAGIAAKDPI